MYGTGWKITLRGEGSVVTGKTSILCEELGDVFNAIEKLASAVGAKTEKYCIEICPVFLYAESEFDEWKELD